MAFFVFAVYRYLSEDRAANLGTHPHKSKIYGFVDSILLEDRIVKSIGKYQGEDLRFFGTIRYPDGNESIGGSIDTIGYKAVSEFVSSTFNTPKTKIWKPKGELPKRNNSKRQSTPSKTPSGCSAFVIMIFSLVILLMLLS
jgi:hypothetical protein